MEKTFKHTPDDFLICEVLDKEEKERLTLLIMNALPEWFRPKEDILRKSKLHREMPFFAAYYKGEAAGFLALKLHNAYTGDIYDLGVKKEYHRMGMGHALVSRAEGYLKERGFRFLTVKTLHESAVYAPYDRTRAFYKKEGFLPLEVMETYWNKENPCLFLIKTLV